MPISPYSKKPFKPGRGSVWHMDISEIFSGHLRMLSTRDLAVFCRKAAFLLDAGLPVKEAMPILSAQLPGKRLKPVILDVHKLIMQGESFSKAIRTTGVFPEFMCGYIDIGEKTAQLPKVCEELADFYDRQAALKDELSAAMMYPAAVTMMMLGVIVLAITLVIPGYADMFAASGMPLPVLTALLINVSDFFVANWIFILAGIFAAIVTAVIFLRSKRGKVFSSRIQLKIPLLRQNVNFRLVQVMSLLLSSGIGISRSIPLCGEVMDNVVVKRDFRKLAVNVNTGMAFWESLEQIKYIDPLLTGLARVGEETGNLPKTIQKCHDYLEASYKHNLRRLNKLIEPVITLVMGIILAAVMLAVVLPTFELATVL